MQFTIYQKLSKIYQMKIQNNHQKYVKFYLIFNIYSNISLAFLGK